MVHYVCVMVLSTPSSVSLCNCDFFCRVSSPSLNSSLNVGRTVEEWLVLLSYSKKLKSLDKRTTFFFQFPSIVQKIKLLVPSKLAVGVNVSVNGLFHAVLDVSSSVTCVCGIISGDTQ